jgi:hypothetical protein
MAAIVAAPPVLAGDLAVYHTTDPLLGNAPILVLYGPATTIGATSSRIQIHIFTPAGIASYARLSVAPTSPFYTAVSNLPREEQGDEVIRGLAFGLKKYFAELSDTVRATWCAQTRAAAIARLFGDEHVAILATRMTKIENVDEVINNVSQAFCEQRLSWLDVDVVLPPGSIQDPSAQPESADHGDVDEVAIIKQKFGRYAELVSSLGEPTFLPTSKLKRAPSKATAIGRTASFLRAGKETVRKEMNELATTEETYVARLSEMQEISSELQAGATPQSKAQLEQILPSSLDKILSLNKSLLAELQEVLTTTEPGAIKDIESMSDENSTAAQSRREVLDDAQGVGALSKCLCEQFPRLAEAYQEYMKSHAEASQLLRLILRSTDPLSTAFQRIGEQRLTSLLIEPVQRLPRYNLYIDSISKQLPVRHPALKPLLKARDIITGICAEVEATGTAVISQRLAARVSGWPADLSSTGRLVTVVDCTELVPPFGIDCIDGFINKIMVLFTDSLVLLGRSHESTTSARALLTELESGSGPATTPKIGTSSGQDFVFQRSIDLVSLQCSELLDGRAIQLLVFDSPQPDLSSVSQPLIDTSGEILRLEGSYEGKVSRFVEEVCKAQIECRFSEPERESMKWEVRATDVLPDNLGLFAAVFENSDVEHIITRKENAATRVIVDIDRHSDRPRAGQQGIRTVIALSSTREGSWRMTVDALDGSFNQEHLAMSEIVPSVRRKLAALLASRLSIDQEELAGYLLDRNLDILRSIELHVPDQDVPVDRAAQSQRERARSRSPRKLISNFLSSVGPSSETPSLLKRDAPVLSMPSQLPRVPSSAGSAASKPPSRDSRPSSRDLPLSRHLSTAHSHQSTITTPMQKLENTLASYILALQTRKGNIVGRNLKMRATADELAVNELYNGLLEDPQTMSLAAQVSVDVLFAAFEKFVSVAWRQQFGPIMPEATMQSLQQKAETMFPMDFDAYMRATIDELPSQNQNAFKDVINLLADLLDGTGNDGDRGSLTVAFTEVLVSDSNPHEYIALIDRFVVDTETYFGESLADIQRPHEHDTISQHKRSRSTNTPSINSNQSSLRKKFGFGSLGRQDSKSDHESKVSSVWRTLSKTGRSDASPGSSISRGSHARHVSVESESRALSSRPSSQDGNKSFTFSEGHSSHSLGLSTIGEHPTFIPTGPPRKKRRSSLSDLLPQENSPKREPLSPPPAESARTVESSATPARSLRMSPPPVTSLVRMGSVRMNTPSRMPRPQLPASFRKELSPGVIKSHGASIPRPKSKDGRVDEVIITTRHNSTKPDSPVKSVPSPDSHARSGLAERPGAGNIIKRSSPQHLQPQQQQQQHHSPEKTRPLPSTVDLTPGRSREMSPSAMPPPLASASRKLRMQSPQKLRERLQAEQQAITAAQISLQDELQSIGDELRATPSRMGSVRVGVSSVSSNNNKTSTPDLTHRVVALEAQIPHLTSTVETRLAGIAADVTSSLAVSEAKCKSLDALYREANGENEALYGRFNDELGKILKAVRGGEGVEELKRLLRESQEEVASLKREGMRLKRENVGLRAQIRDG